MRFRKLNKAIVASISGISVLASILFGTNIEWLTPELTVGIGAVVTPFLVWLVPNKD